MDEDNLMIMSVFKPKDWSIGVVLPGRKELVDCMRQTYDHDYARILNNAIVREDMSHHVSINGLLN